MSSTRQMMGSAGDPKTQEDRLRMLIEDVADGFYETDLQGRFKFFNDALCRIFGRGRDQIQDHSYREFMDAANAGFAFESFNRLYSAGHGATDLVWEIQRPDGRPRVLEISAKLILGEDNRPLGFRGIARDVTERHQAQENAKAAEALAQCQYALSRRAEQRYRALLDFLPDPVFVFNMDGTVSYLNAAFQRVFGWSLKELEGKKIPFVPEPLREETRCGMQRLLAEGVIHGFETRRLTKAGDLLDIVLEGAIFYEEGLEEPSGQVIILRDVTRQKRVQRTNRALFRIANALPRYRRLDELLDFITGEVRELLDVEGAMVILPDESRNEFFFRATTFNDTQVGRRFKEVRFPADKGVAAQVYRTGKPLIVPDTAKDRYYFQRVDEMAGFNTRNMLDVPIRIAARIIGVLCTVNKKDGGFNQEDVDLLGTVAGSVALPVENARIHEELRRSYEEVKRLNRAKERVIHHLSHELKTPVSVLSGSLTLLGKMMPEQRADDGWQRVMERARRNISRLLEMQYEIEDMLREQDFRTHQLLSSLVLACADELETLAEEASGAPLVLQRIQQRIDALFGPREAKAESVPLGRFVAEQLEALKPRFAHRRLTIHTDLHETPTVWIPPIVLAKVVEGLVRNAVENTPDGGRIDISVGEDQEGPELKVQDFGVGITAENQRLIFDNYFTGYEPAGYSSKQPYDFGAGGRGFDLLRIQFFAERFAFKLKVDSGRCAHLPNDRDRCPGAIENCRHCKEPGACLSSGGTTMRVLFGLARRQPSADASATP